MSTFLEAKRMLAKQAKRDFAYWTEYFATHCWHCNGEYDTNKLDKCPHCGKDTVPF